MIRAINADLARLGYVDPPLLPETVEFETTSLAMPERAVPQRPRGRTPHIAEE